VGVQILICQNLRNNLQHPNEYIRGVTLRFLCRIREEEILEPLIPSILACLEHRHSYVRRNAVLAINALYKLPKGEHLLQDAPELIEKVGPPGAARGAARRAPAPRRARRVTGAAAARRRPRAQVLQSEQDLSTKRNAFQMLCNHAQDLATNYLLSQARRCSSSVSKVLSRGGGVRSFLTRLREERHTPPAAPRARAPAPARERRGLLTYDRAVSRAARVRALWPRSGWEQGRSTASAAAPALPNAGAAARRPLRLCHSAPAVRRSPGEAAAAQVDNVAHWGDILQLAVLELIRKVCRGAPAEKGRHMKTILALLQSTSTAVVYECAVTLVSLSQARRSRAPRRVPHRPASWTASWGGHSFGKAGVLKQGRWLMHTSLALRVSQASCRLVQVGHFQPLSATSSPGPWRGGGGMKSRCSPVDNPRVWAAQAPTAIRAAANCFCQLLVSQSDNNVKLIVLDRLQARAPTCALTDGGARPFLPPQRPW